MMLVVTSLGYEISNLSLVGLALVVSLFVGAT